MENGAARVAVVDDVVFGAVLVVVFNVVFVLVSASRRRIGRPRGVFVSRPWC